MQAWVLSRQLLVAPRSLQWWQWGKALGPWLLAVAVSCSLIGIHWPLVLALHVFVDFTCQSTSTAIAKAQKNWCAIVLHGLLAGGWPVVSLGVGAIVTSALSHILIDATGKFGLKDPYGPVADQVCHGLMLVVIMALFKAL